MSNRSAGGPKPEPFYDSGGVTIYHGDCEQIAPTLPEVDLVLRDPPYGIDYSLSDTTDGCTNITERQTRRKVTGDDKDFDPAPWLAYPNVMMWGANHYASRLPEFGSWHAWDKTRGGKGPDDDFSDVEFAWSSNDGNSSIYHFLWKGAMKDGRNAKRLHATQKPVPLMAWCLRFFPECETVLDPYAGSGSTLIAARKLGLEAIGIEIEKGDCVTMRKRLSQGNLFQAGTDEARTQGTADGSVQVPT